MAKRVDCNQPGIVQALRRVGAKVQHLHELGHGCPDILVLFRNELTLMEIKVPCAGLTPDERKWHEDWQCSQLVIVHSPEEALRAIGAIE